MVDLGVLDPDAPEGGWMFPNGMSADGSVIVGGALTSEGYKAFIWDPQHGLRALQDVLTGGLGLDLSGWSLMMANGISDDGTTVTGTGIRNGRLEAWVAVIPEPRAAVVLAGFVLVGWRRRRERGQCLRCGYDLKGNVIGVRLECGAVTPGIDVKR